MCRALVGGELVEHEDDQAFKVPLEGSKLLREPGRILNAVGRWDSEQDFSSEHLRLSEIETPLQKEW